MSATRFLTDNDFKEQIVQGVLRREPAAEFVRVRDVGGQDWPDPQVLEFAAATGLLVLSHDVSTMRPTAERRLANGLLMRGLFLVPQRARIAPVIDNLLLIWSASDADEWIGQIRFLPF